MTEATSTICTSTEPKEPLRRAEPTEEAKTAGQAALARLEAKKNDKPRFNTCVTFKITFIYYYTCFYILLFNISKIIRVFVLSI